MNICFIVTRGDLIGGAQIHVRDMSIALQNDGHRVIVLIGTTGDMTDQLDKAGIEWKQIPSLVRTINPIKDLYAVFSVFRLLRTVKPDLLSCHTAKSGMIGRIAAFLAGIPSIFTAHGWQFADGIPVKQARIVQLIEKLVSPLCRRVITVSMYDFDLACRKKVVNPVKMVTIHNGLPWRNYSKKAFPLSGLNSSIRPGGHTHHEPCRLLMVARFQKQKDHETLFNALAGLTDLNWQLELVGEGECMAVEKARVHRLGLDSRITFSGQRRDVPERMDNADIYVLISNWEGFPRSIIEAMRSGLPVIASDVGGCSEAVIEGESGFLVPRGDAAVLGRRISSLIRDSGLRYRMGSAGRARYEREFTFRRMYGLTVKLYSEILSI